MILEAGKTLSAPRSADAAVDRMLENAFYGAQVLDGASAGRGSYASRSQQHPSKSLPTVAHASPVIVQQASSLQQHPHPQLQRFHSSSTASSSSDTSRAPYSQPAPHSPSRPGASANANPNANARVKVQLSPRDVKAKIKTNSPLNGKATAGLHGYPHASASDTAPAVSVSSPSKPKVLLAARGLARCCCFSSFDIETHLVLS